VAIIEPEATPQAEAARSRAEVMESLFLFTDLPFHQRLRVARICEARVIGPRENLATQGTPGDAMFVIVEGQVTIEHNGVALATLKAGEHFGEIALLDARPRSATVTSRMAGSVIVIRRAAFKDFCQREPELGGKLLFQLATTLAGRLRLANERMTEVTRTITI
jgi:CRP-like cAMP-binding protein